MNRYGTRQKHTFSLCIFALIFWRFACLQFACTLLLGSTHCECVFFRKIRTIQNTKKRPQIITNRFVEFVDKIKEQKSIKYNIYFLTNIVYIVSYISIASFLFNPTFSATTKISSDIGSMLSFIEVVLNPFIPALGSKSKAGEKCHSPS